MILGANVVFSPCYARRNILSARDMIMAGARWKICNRRKIKIWGDNWLLESASFKVHSCVRVLDKYSMVNDLIDQDIFMWKRPHNNLLETKQIFSIPLSLTRSEDKLFWHMEKYGAYFVKSVYHNLVVADCIKSVNFFVTLEAIVLDCSMLLNRFNKAFVMYLSRRLNLDAHHTISVGIRLGSRTWMGCIPQVKWIAFM